MIEITIDDRAVLAALDTLQRRVSMTRDGVEYVAVFEVLTRRRMLALKSMWKRGRPPIIRQ